MCYPCTRSVPAGKKRLLGDTTREATSTEVADVRKDVAELKQVVAELVLVYRHGISPKTSAVSPRESERED